MNTLIRVQLMGHFLKNSGVPHKLEPHCTRLMYKKKYETLPRKKFLPPIHDVVARTKNFSPPNEVTG